MTGIRITVSPDELIAIGKAGRSLVSLVELLDAGELEKVVLLGNDNAMRAVVLTVEEYARLTTAGLALTRPAQTTTT